MDYLHSTTRRLFVQQCSENRNKLDVRPITSRCSRDRYLRWRIPAEEHGLRGHLPGYLPAGTLVAVALIC